jgi:hypothetical protein
VRVKVRRESCGTEQIDNSALFHLNGIRKNGDSVVGVEGRRVGFRVPVRAKFLFPNIVQAEFGDYSSSFPMGTEHYFPESRAAWE